MNKLTRSFSISVLIAVLQDLKESGYRSLTIKEILQLLVIDKDKAVEVMNHQKEQLDKNYPQCGSGSKEVIG